MGLYGCRQGSVSSVVASGVGKHDVSGCFRRPSSTFCARGGSEKIRKNGHACNGAQRAKCLECERTFILEPAGPRYGQQIKDQVLAAYQDRMSTRGITRTFGGLLQHAHALGGGKKWRACPPSRTRFLPAEKGDVLELDELWSFVQSKAQTLWLWVALCRRTRQVVAYTLGDRSQQSAADLRASLPQDYRGRATRSDLWEALCRRFPGQDPPLLRQRRRRNLPRRTLVWHPARSPEPPGAPGVLLFQVPGETTWRPSTSSSPPTTCKSSSKHQMR